MPEAAGYTTQAIEQNGEFQVFKRVSSDDTYAAAVLSADLDPASRARSLTVDAADVNHLNESFQAWVDEFNQKKQEITERRKREEEERGHQGSTDTPDAEGVAVDLSGLEDTITDLETTDETPDEVEGVQFAQSRNNPNDGPFEDRRGDTWDSRTMVSARTKEEDTDDLDEEQTQGQNAARRYAELLQANLRQRIQNSTLIQRFLRSPNPANLDMALLTDAAAETQEVSLSYTPFDVPGAESTIISPTETALVSERGSVRPNNEDSAFSLDSGFMFGDIGGFSPEQNSEKQLEVAKIIAQITRTADQEQGIIEQNATRINKGISLGLKYLEDLRNRGVIQGIEIVSAGMGAHASGEIGGALALTGVLSSLSILLEKNPMSEELLHQALSAGNKLVDKYNMVTRSDTRASIAIVVRAADSVYISNIGDTRVYMQNTDGTIMSLTQDTNVHSLRYIMDPTNPLYRPSRSLEENSPLRKAMGKTTMQDVEIMKMGQLAPGQKIIIADDGIYNDFDRNASNQIVIDTLEKIDKEYIFRFRQLEAQGMSITSAASIAYREAHGRFLREINLAGVPANATAEQLCQALFKNNGSYSGDNVSAIVISA